MAHAVDLLPCDAEFARRAAGGDGAAFVRLYDRYSNDVFTTVLSVTGSVEAAATATQAAFLRMLRWPPRLGASDGDVVELLYALALGGSNGRAPASPDTAESQALARLVGVGWLRSETVAKAGARFGADWSEYLWSPPAEVAGAPARAAAPVVAHVRSRMRLPRLRVPLPSPALGVVVVLASVLFAGAGGTILANDSSDTRKAPPAAETRKAEVGKADKRAPGAWGKSRILRRRALEPLLAP